MTQDRFVIVFVLFPGVTPLDLVGPHEVFSRLPHATLIVASREGGEIESATGLVFADVHALAEVERCDLLCVPGGPGVDAALSDADLLSEIQRLAAGARYVTSVCTGALLLGAAGLLQGRRATTHWASLDLLPLFGAIPADERVVRDGDLFTGGGVTAGIDFALTVVAEIADETSAQIAQLMIEYAPQPPFQAGRPDEAPAQIVATVRGFMARGLVARRGAAEQAAARLGAG